MLGVGLEPCFFTIENEGRKREGFKNDRHSAAVCSVMAWSPVFLQLKMKVEKERASKMITTLRPFAQGWLGALFFTIENEGLKTEGFKIDHRSAAVCSVIAWSLVFLQ